MKLPAIFVFYVCQEIQALLYRKVLLSKAEIISTVFTTIFAVNAYLYCILAFEDV